MPPFLKKSIGWLVSIFFLALVLMHLDWHEFMQQISRISALALAGLVAIYLCGFVLRGWRCKLLLPALGFEQSTKGVILGYAANNLLPARLGELVRAQVVGKAAGIKRSTTLSSILVERVMDGFAIVILLVAGSGGLQLPDWALKLRLMGIAIFSAALLGILLLGFTDAFWRSKLPAGRLGELAHGLIDGVCLATRDIPTIFMVVFLSLAIWSVEGLMFYQGFGVFGMPISFVGSYFVLGVVNLGVLIPSSPGNVGVFQYFTVLALNVFQVPKSQSMAYSVIVHMCQYLPITVLGVIFLHQMGYRSFSEMRVEEKKNS